MCGGVGPLRMSLCCLMGRPPKKLATRTPKFFHFFIFFHRECFFLSFSGFSKKKEKKTFSFLPGR